MVSLRRVLLTVGALVLILLPAADAGAAPLQTIKLRVPVPAAGDLSVLSFELSIGGEGRRHRKQAVMLRLVSHPQTGVFAIARLRPEPRRPGRFLGVLEVFHRRGGAAAALPSGLSALAQAPPFARAHAAVPPSDEFWVRARNERLIKTALKANIVTLATHHKLGPYEFCSAHHEQTYILGNIIIGASYLLAGPLTELPTNTNPSQLADDAVYELCDEVEDYEEGDYKEDDEEELPGIHVLSAYLGAREPQRMPSGYRVLFRGSWRFEGPNEVKLIGLLSGASYTHPLAHSADSTNPVDAIKVVLPPSGATPRKVTNYICPAQLPAAAITTTSNAGDTLTCSGGSLTLGQQFSLNVQSSPLPSSGMGGQLLAHQDGAYLAPFPITGP
jgi:hypothetical protein